MHSKSPFKQSPTGELTDPLIELALRVQLSGVPPAYGSWQLTPHPPLHEGEKQPVIQDLAAEVARIKGEGSRLEQAFQKSFEAHRSQSTVLNKKFDELLKQAKESGDDTPPVRDFDL